MRRSARSSACRSDLVGTLVVDGRSRRWTPPPPDCATFCPCGWLVSCCFSSDRSSPPWPPRTRRTASLGLPGRAPAMSSGSRPTTTTRSPATSPSRSRARSAFPMLGRVEVAGQTTSEIADRLEALLEKDYYVDVQLQVEVEEYHSKPVTVLGEVARPGTYYLEGQTSLHKILAEAGGLKRLGGSVCRAAPDRRRSTGSSSRLSGPMGPTSILKGEDRPRRHPAAGRCDLGLGQRAASSSPARWPNPVSTI